MRAKARATTVSEVNAGPLSSLSAAGSADVGEIGSYSTVADPPRVAPWSFHFPLKKRINVGHKSRTADDLSIRRYKIWYVARWYLNRWSCS